MVPSAWKTSQMPVGQTLGPAAGIHTDKANAQVTNKLFTAISRKSPPNIPSDLLAITYSVYANRKLIPSEFE